MKLSKDMIDALVSLASAQGRELDELVNDAIREYLISASITDLSSDQIADAQLALARELTAAS